MSGPIVGILGIAVMFAVLFLFRHSGSVYNDDCRVS